MIDIKNYFKDYTFLSIEGIESVPIRGTSDFLLISTLSCAVKCFLRLESSNFAFDNNNESIVSMKDVANNIFSCLSLNEVLTLVTDDAQGIATSINSFLEFLEQETQKLDKKRLALP